jgi:predicted Ser/Thr protein kinase
MNKSMDFLTTPEASELSQPMLTTLSRSATRGQALGDLTLLDIGDQPVKRHHLQELLNSLAQNRIPLIHRGLNSLCYKVLWACGHADFNHAVLKTARLHALRTNLDTTYANEARMLGLLSGLYIGGMPRLGARFRQHNRHYLLTSFVAGDHPHVLANPFKKTHLGTLLDTLFKLDINGILHYDLQSSNLLLTSTGVRLIDFEFTRKHNLLEAYHKKNQAFHRDYNTATNPYFPMRSNVCNFEFRTLHDYCLKSVHTHQRFNGMEFQRSFLRAKAGYHHKLKNHLTTLHTYAADEISRVSAKPVENVVAALRRAVHFEGILERLFENPDNDILESEEMLRHYRYLCFQQDFNGRNVDLRAISNDMLRRLRLSTIKYRHMGNRDGSLYFIMASHLLYRLNQRPRPLIQPS